MLESFFPWLLILVGLVALVLGGDVLVRGASAIAAAMHIPPLVIGLTVVAFGTSAPELGVSLQAALSGAADVGVGNIVGSNIFNLLFVLGASAVVTPMIVSRQLIRFDVPVMISVSVLAWLLARDGIISRIDGVILFVLLICYLAICLRTARREAKASREAEAANAQNENPSSRSGPMLIVYLGYIVVGLIMLRYGSKWLVSGAVTIAQQFGVSELVIGLTIVAVGTSLPEVVTSVMAAIRGARDIAVGNVVGSNIFNICCVLGLSGIFAPQGILVSDQALRFDIPAMLAISIFCWPVFARGYRIGRWEGALFLSVFVAYTAWLILR